MSISLDLSLIDSPSQELRELLDEFQLGRAFDEITADILSKPKVSVETILDARLLQLQGHLGLVLA